MTIYDELSRLIDYSLQNSLIEECDRYVVQNMLMQALSLDSWEFSEANYQGESIDEILAPIIGYACENGIIPDTTGVRDLFDTKIMGIFTPMPREVSGKFRALLKQDKRQATDWYFDFCQKLNYVRAGRIVKDIKWVYDCEYGALDITINRSKPEKDPRDIAAVGAHASSSYPKCQLCPENAGFAGHASHPARQNLRPVSVTIDGAKWQLQYSPYSYFNEHCIVFNEKHVPMVIDRSVFEKLFDFVDILPHYFVGSNADLPIVGGSILSHEHFQGGNYEFAMATAPVERKIEIKGGTGVEAGIVKWPMSVIRLVSENRKQLADCCNTVLTEWRTYSDESAFIFSETNGERHNTVTPIARKRGGRYECDLVLRNNICTEERPLGVFHPKPSLHHIKKENIGLIEVLGLAILPSRLADEMTKLREVMLAGRSPEDYPELAKHAEWAKDILSRRPDFSKDNAQRVIREEIGRVFLEVLCDAGVFKRTPEGQAAFDRFIRLLG